MEPALAGPGGKIARAAVETFWGRAVLGALAIIFLPLISYILFKDMMAERRAYSDLRFMARHSAMFEWLKLRERAKECFHKVHSAWEAEDLSSMSNWITDWYWQNQQLAHLEKWKKQHLVNICDVKKITSIQPILFVHRNHGVMLDGKFGHGFVSAYLGGVDGQIGGWQGLVASMVIGGTISEITGGKFSNGAASAGYSYAMSWAASKVDVGGTSYEVEGDPSAIDGIPTEPEKTYKEGLALAKGNPHVHGAERAEYVDKVRLGKCVSVDKCAYKKDFLSNAEAKEFMLNNKGWSQIVGEYSGGNIWIYRGATAAKVHYFQDTIKAARRSSGRDCGCTRISGAENVLKTLAHEGGHFSGLDHMNELYIRERHAIEFKRGFGL